MEIGTVTGSSITKNKDGDTDVVVVQATITDDDDAQNAELVTHSGEDSPPLPGAVAFIMELVESDKYIIAVDDTVVPEREPGEKEFYVLVPGATLDDPPVKVAKLQLLNTGDHKVLANKFVVLKGEADFAVRFNSLNTQIEELKTQINAQNFKKTKVVLVRWCVSSTERILNRTK